MFRLRVMNGFTLKTLAFALIAIAAFSGIRVDSARAQTGETSLGIAAVVNNDIISQYDVESRIRFVLFTSGIKPDGQARQRILPDVLRTLIDETLKNQAADDAGIHVSDRELDQEIKKLEERNHMPEGGIEKLFRENGIPIGTLRAQIKAQLGWNKFIQREGRREIRIGEDEIDEELKRLRQSGNQLQKRVFEIFLPIESPDRVAPVRQTAQQILQQLQSGTPFSALARSFSQGSSAAFGGDLGWISPGQMPPELDDAVRALSPGQVSKPIETISGLYILSVAEQRSLLGDPKDSKADLVQIMFPNGTSDAEIRKTRDSIDSCDAARALSKDGSDIKVIDTPGVRVGDMPQKLGEVVLSMKEGETSPPLKNNQGTLVLALCKISAPEGNLPSRNEIRSTLASRRFELLARKKLRDLKQAAFIDVRM